MNNFVFVILYSFPQKKAPQIAYASGPTKPAYAPGLEADYSLTSSADVKNEWSHASTPSICLHGVDRKTLL